jgi:hypothetical protein
MQRMDAQELTQWVVWMSAEQIGPDWDRLRHVQLSGVKFDNPWAPPPMPKTREEHLAQMELELAAIEDAYPCPVRPGG